MVALTRTLGRTTVGVSHKCICPSWAETEMVLGARMESEEEKSGLQKSIKVTLIALFTAQQIITYVYKV